ncbi:MAG: polysaccharide biosynthesis tyrosine autokinase [Pseudomonadota bacterium]
MHDQGKNFTSQPAGDQSIGDILRAANNLSAEQVQSILDHQKKANVRFGEAAVALGILKREEVIWALAQQFHYPYAQGDTIKLSDTVVAAKSPFSDQAEFFRDIRSQLIMNVFTSGAISNSVAVTSADIGDGKSFFAANLAVVFAQLGARTLLIDADMRTPVQHTLFGVDNSTGLSSILSGRAEPNVIRPVASLPSLYLLPVGVTPPNPIELVERPVFGLLIKELASKFEYVVIDTPAASHGSDGLIVASRCGATVALARCNQTRNQALQKLVGRLSKSPTKFAGVIVNDH